MARGAQSVYTLGPGVEVRQRGWGMSTAAFSHDDHAGMDLSDAEMNVLATKVAEAMEKRAHASDRTHLILVGATTAVLAGLMIFFALNQQENYIGHGLAILGTVIGHATGHAAARRRR
jgi:hypothetical protein